MRSPARTSSWRAVLRVDKGCISDVLVYRQADRRRGIASDLYDLVEADLGRSLVPSKIRSKDGRLFWTRRQAVLQASPSPHQIQGHDT